MATFVLWVFIFTSLIAICNNHPTPQGGVSAVRGRSFSSLDNRLIDLLQKIHHNLGPNTKMFLVKPIAMEELPKGQPFFMNMHQTNNGQLIPLFTPANVVQMPGEMVKKSLKAGQTEAQLSEGIPERIVLNPSITSSFFGHNFGFDRGIQSKNSKILTPQTSTSPKRNFKVIQTKDITQPIRLVLDKIPEMTKLIQKSKQPSDKGLPSTQVDQHKVTEVNINEKKRQHTEKMTQDTQITQKEQSKAKKTEHSIQKETLEPTVKTQPILEKNIQPKHVDAPNIPEMGEQPNAKTTSIKQGSQDEKMMLHSKKVIQDTQVTHKELSIAKKAENSTQKETLEQTLITQGIVEKNIQPMQADPQNVPEMMEPSAKTKSIKQDSLNEKKMLHTKKVTQDTHVTHKEQSKAKNAEHSIQEEKLEQTVKTQPLLEKNIQPKQADTPNAPEMMEQPSTKTKSMKKDPQNEKKIHTKKVTQDTQVTHKELSKDKNAEHSIQKETLEQTVITQAIVEKNTQPIQADQQNVPEMLEPSAKTKSTKQDSHKAAEITELADRSPKIQQIVIRDQIISKPRDKPPQPKQLVVQKVSENKELRQSENLLDTKSVSKASKLENHSGHSLAKAISASPDSKNQLEDSKNIKEMASHSEDKLPLDQSSPSLQENEASSMKAFLESADAITDVDYIDQLIGEIDAVFQDPVLTDKSKSSQDQIIDSNISGQIPETEHNVAQANKAKSLDKTPQETVLIDKENQPVAVDVIKEVTIVKESPLKLVPTMQDTRIIPDIISTSDIESNLEIFNSELEQIQQTTLMPDIEKEEIIVQMTMQENQDTTPSPEQDIALQSEHDDGVSQLFRVEMEVNKDSEMMQPLAATTTEVPVSEFMKPSTIDEIPTIEMEHSQDVDPEILEPIPETTVQTTQEEIETVINIEDNLSVVLDQETIMQEMEFSKNINPGTTFDITTQLPDEEIITMNSIENSRSPATEENIKINQETRPETFTEEFLLGKTHPKLVDPILHMPREEEILQTLPETLDPKDPPLKIKETTIKSKIGIEDDIAPATKVLIESEVLENKLKGKSIENKPSIQQIEMRDDPIDIEITTTEIPLDEPMDLGINDTEIDLVEVEAEIDGLTLSQDHSPDKITHFETDLQIKSPIEEIPSTKSRPRMGTRGKRPIAVTEQDDSVRELSESQKIRAGIIDSKIREINPKLSVDERRPLAFQVLQILQARRDEEKRNQTLSEIEAEMIQNKSSDKPEIVLEKITTEEPLTSSTDKIDLKELEIETEMSLTQIDDVMIQTVTEIIQEEIEQTTDASLQTDYYDLLLSEIDNLNYDATLDDTAKDNMTKDSQPKPDEGLVELNDKQSPTLPVESQLEEPKQSIKIALDEELTASKSKKEQEKPIFKVVKITTLGDINDLAQELDKLEEIPSDVIPKDTVKESVHRFDLHSEQEKELPIVEQDKFKSVDVKEEESLIDPIEEKKEVKDEMIPEIVQITSTDDLGLFLEEITTKPELMEMLDELTEKPDLSETGTEATPIVDSEIELQDKTEESISHNMTHSMTDEELVTSTPGKQDLDFKSLIQSQPASEKIAIENIDKTDVEEKVQTEDINEKKENDLIIDRLFSDILQQNDSPKEKTKAIEKLTVKPVSRVRGNVNRVAPGNIQNLGQRQRVGRRRFVRPNSRFRNQRRQRNRILNRQKPIQKVPEETSRVQEKHIQVSISKDVGKEEAIIQESLAERVKLNDVKTKEKTQEVIKTKVDKPKVARVEKVAAKIEPTKDKVKPRPSLASMFQKQETKLEKERKPTLSQKVERVEVDDAKTKEKTQEVITTKANKTKVARVEKVAAKLEPTEDKVKSRPSLTSIFKKQEPKMEKERKPILSQNERDKLTSRFGRTRQKVSLANRLLESGHANVKAKEDDKKDPKLKTDIPFVTVRRTVSLGPRTIKSETKNVNNGNGIEKITTNVVSSTTFSFDEILSSVSQNIRSEPSISVVSRDSPKETSSSNTLESRLHESERNVNKELATNGRPIVFQRISDEKTINKVKFSPIVNNGEEIQQNEQGSNAKVAPSHSEAQIDLDNNQPSIFDMIGVK